MGQRYDRALAQAELALAKRVYDPAPVLDYQGFENPSWIRDAARYTKLVIEAFIKETLDPTLPDPQRQIDLVTAHLIEVTARLYKEHFFHNVLAWNIRMMKAESEDDLRPDELRILGNDGLQPMDEGGFRSLVLTFARSSERATIDSMLDRSIQSFWQARLRLTSKHPPKAKRITKAPRTPFPNRAKWLADRMRDRALSPNSLYSLGGPDKNTVKRILDGLSVQEGTLGKVVTALNARGGKEKVALLDIPTD